MNQPRLLKADEIEIRVGQMKDDGSGASFLLYKNARVDMNILDETYGVGGWQRTHEVINGNLFCNIDIWDEDKKQWVRKQDAGVESKAQKEKGEASDAFKRAGFNVGIGRELYTPLFIWINLNTNETQTKKDGKRSLSYKAKFHVSKISYDDNRKIICLVVSDTKGKPRFTHGLNLPLNKEIMGTPEDKKPIDTVKAKALMSLIDETETDVNKVLANYQVSTLNEMTMDQYTNAVKYLQKKRK